LHLYVEVSGPGFGGPRVHGFREAWSDADVARFGEAAGGKALLQGALPGVLGCGARLRRARARLPSPCAATRAFLAPVLDAATGIALTAERAFLRVLDGSCKTPIGAYARVEAGNVAFHAIVLKPDGSRFFETAASGPLAEAASLGQTAGQELVAQIPAGFFDF
jgi:hypothetical protein